MLLYDVPKRLTGYRDDLEMVLSSNVVGVRNITRAMLPVLKRSQQKKIVNMYVFELLVVVS